MRMRSGGECLSQVTNELSNNPLEPLEVPLIVSGWRLSRQQRATAQ